MRRGLGSLLALLALSVALLSCSDEPADGGRAGGGSGAGDVSASSADSGQTSDGAGVADSGGDVGATDVANPQDTEAATEEAEVAPTGDLPTRLADEVDAARYAVDLTFIAAERPPGSAHWQAVQDHCAETFEDLGYEVELHAFDEGVNVIGVLAGQERPNEHVIVSAHYDHIPGCAGADDNASGVAGVLEAARVLAQERYARTLVVACWDQEEWGLLGSEAYAARALERGEDVVVSLVYEMIGYRDDEPGSQALPTGFDMLFAEQTAWVEANDYRGDFMALIADDFARAPALDMLARADQDALKAVHIELTHEQTGLGVFHTLRRSDHDPFWQAGWGAIMITDTAEFRNTHYHCVDGPDDVSRLDTGFAADIVRATVFAAAATLDSP
jgi:hypothetical protein